MCVHMYYMFVRTPALQKVASYAHLSLLLLLMHICHICVSNICACNCVYVCVYICACVCVCVAHIFAPVSDRPIICNYDHANIQCTRTS